MSRAEGRPKAVLLHAHGMRLPLVQRRDFAGDGLVEVEVVYVGEKMAFLAVLVTTVAMGGVPDEAGDEPEHGPVVALVEVGTGFGLDFEEFRSGASVALFGSVTRRGIGIRVSVVDVLYDEFAHGHTSVWRGLDRALEDQAIQVVEMRATAGPSWTLCLDECQSTLFTHPWIGVSRVRHGFVGPGPADLFEYSFRRVAGTELGMELGYGHRDSRGFAIEGHAGAWVGSYGGGGVLVGVRCMIRLASIRARPT